MRALASSLSFLVVIAALAGRARAHVPLFAPRVSLSLAFDWNKMARQALLHPERAPATVVARRHQPPRLAMTSGPVTAAPPPLQRSVGRAELYMRVVLVPTYISPEEMRRTRMFTAAYVTPYTPYLGCYGAMLTVQSDALLR
jgi:hypothetical protein